LNNFIRTLDLITVSFVSVYGGRNPQDIKFNQSGVLRCAGVHIKRRYIPKGGGTEQKEGGSEQKERVKEGVLITKQAVLLSALLFDNVRHE
jgi:hypothetical protein